MEKETLDRLYTYLSDFKYKELKCTSTECKDCRYMSPDDSSELDGIACFINILMEDVWKRRQERYKESDHEDSYGEGYE